MKKQLFLLLATTIVATTFAGCSCTGSKTATDTTTESTVESTTPTKNENATEPEQPTTTVADIETDSNITEIETTVEEPTTEQPTDEPTTEAPIINKEPEVKKDYEIVWSSNPYFFTKKFSDGTEKYYFTYRANIEMSGKETTAIGVIPPEEIPYLDYEPDYYINGQTGNPYDNSNKEEYTNQSQDSTTGSSNQTENETEQSTYPPISSGQEDYDKESFEDFINDNGVTMQP